MNKEDKQGYFNVMKNYKRLMSNLAAQIVAYDSWSNEFSREQIQDLYDKLIKEFKDVDFTQFTPEELLQFDFQWFDEDLLCLPPWVIDCLPEGTKLTSINGDEFEFKRPKNKNEMKDSRFGVTAYGFTKSQLRDAKLEELLDEED